MGVAHLYPNSNAVGVLVDVQFRQLPLAFRHHPLSHVRLAMGDCEITQTAH